MDGYTPASVRVPLLKQFGNARFLRPNHLTGVATEPPMRSNSCSASTLIALIHNEGGSTTNLLFHGC